MDRDTFDATAHDLEQIDIELGRIYNMIRAIVDRRSRAMSDPALKTELERLATYVHDSRMYTKRKKAEISK